MAKHILTQQANKFHVTGPIYLFFNFLLGRAAAQPVGPPCMQLNEHCTGRGGGMSEATIAALEGSLCPTNFPQQGEVRTKDSILHPS